MPEVGDLLGMSERAARDWVRRHELPTTGGRPVRVIEALVLTRMAAEGRKLPKSPEVISEPPGSTPEVPGSSSEAPVSGEPIEAAYTVAGDTPPLALVPLAAVADQLQGLADRLADLAERNEGLALEVGQLRERTANQQEVIAHQAEALTSERATVAELRRRAEAAEAERDELRRQAATTPADDPAITAQRNLIDDQQALLEETRDELAQLRWLLAAEQGPKASPQPASEAPTVLVLAETPAAPAPSGSFWRRVRRVFGGE
jgi:septal ring-binding cell division protein DamX